jgi:hypothetical protein
VDHAEAVGLVQPVDEVEGLGDGLLGRQRALVADEVVEGPPGHQLHDDVRPAGVLVGGEHEHAARVGHAAGQPALEAEAFQRLGRAGVLG